jgi:lipase ATG15
MPRKRSWLGLGVQSLSLSAVLLSGTASAVGYQPPTQQVPIIPPLVPLDGAEATPDTHEFVSSLMRVGPLYLYINNWY